MNKQTEVYLLAPVLLEQIFETNGRRSFNKTGVIVEYHGNIRPSVKLWDKSLTEFTLYVEQAATELSVM